MVDLLIIKFLVIFSGALFSVAATAAICDGEFTRPAYKSRGYYCTNGQMVVDAYAPEKTVLCEEMEVDHLISLRHAWDSGVCAEDLKRLANDPRNLKFTHWRTNRAKGYLSPEDFARTLPPTVAEKVRSDAAAVMRDYKIRPSRELVSNRILSYAIGSAKTERLSLRALPSTVRGKIVSRRIGNRVVVFIGKRAIGYATGAGVAIETIVAAGWALNLLTSPTQDEKMKKRAEFLGTVLHGDQ